MDHGYTGATATEFGFRDLRGMFPYPASVVTGGEVKPQLISPDVHSDFRYSDF